MPRKRRSLTPDAPLAAVPSEVLDQFVRQGPLSHEEEGLHDLKARGCPDILIAVTDGLKGMSEALAAIFPATMLQTCIVHLLRHSLDYATWKERQALAAALRPIYTAPSADAAGAALDTLEQARGARGSRRSSPRGGALGPTSFRSSHFRPRSGA